MSISTLLQDYARGNSSLETVTRALISHDDWIVPAAHAAIATGRQRFERAQILTQDCNMAVDELWIYSDDAALQTAIDAGVRIGTVVRPVGGIELYGALAQLDVRALKVNMGCPIEQAWFIGADAFALIALWTQALAVERALQAAPSAERTRTLREFPGYLVLFHAEQDAIATVRGAGGYDNPAMLFTALDCCNAVHSQYPQLQRRTWSGDDLAHHLPKLGVDGIVSNPYGPGPALGFSFEGFVRMLG